jgi:hypothetical protein
MLSPIKMPFVGAALLTLLAVLVSGCASTTTQPSVIVPPAGDLLAPPAGFAKYKVKSVEVKGSEKPFEVSWEGRFFGGDRRWPIFPKKARETLDLDLREYVKSRFEVDSSSNVAVVLTLEQAHSYLTWKSSGATWIPFVGVAVAVGQMFQQVPVTFTAEVKVDVSVPSRENRNRSIFSRRNEVVNLGDTAALAGNWEKQRPVYLKQIGQIRRDLFDRIDAELITTLQPSSPSSVAGGRKAELALLESEIARLETALADEIITKTEFDRLISSLKQPSKP